MHAMICLLSLVLVLWSGIAHATNTHGLPSTDAELRAYFGDGLVPYALADSCVPTVPGSSLTLPAFACKAYVLTTTGELLYVNQAAAAVGPLNSGNGTYWMAAVKSPTGTVSGWTRQSTTHYVWKFAAVQPADPSEGLVFAKITVAGGVITAVADVASARRWPPDIGRTAGWIFVNEHATGGDGTAATPWTGWEPLFTTTAGKYFYFACGYYQTSQSLVINDTANGYVGPFTLHGCNSGGPSGLGSIILFVPLTGTATSQVSAIGNATVRTLFDIGTIGAELINITIQGLTVRATETTFAKRAWHLVDARNLVFANNNVDGFYDTTGNSIAFHIEGRGQNRIVHNTFYTSNYPMIIDGTPNEGGVCYPTDPGWTGTQGACEFDTSTIEDISLAVSRYTAGPIGQISFPHPNIYIGAPVTLNRSRFHRIDCNGGAYCIYWHGTSSVNVRNDHFSSISWEDEQPLDPTQVGASRITARVPPSVMNKTNLYGDNTYLQQHANWGFMFGFDMSGSPAGAFHMQFENIEQEAGGNGFSLHGIQGVTIDHYIYSGNGFNSSTYPGQCDMAVNPCVDAFPPNVANRAVVLDITGTVAGGSTVYPLTCTNCFAGAYNQLTISTDVQVTDQTIGPDPVMYQSASKTNVFPSSARVVWDSIAFTVPAGQALGTFTWTPKLMDGSGNEAQYTSRSGVMAIRQSGAGSVITSGRWLDFSAYIDVSGVVGMTGADELHIEATAGDFFSPTYCPTGACPGTPYYYPVSTMMTGVTLPAGYTSVTAMMPGGDQVILFYTTGATGLAAHRMQVLEIAAGTIIAINGSVPLP